ncbi:hypothetical protein CSAL01_13657 [Colletotrichum salicis]|uniref:Uncharacterized protein n=1 Tax=Colletotrichum salicis TaxID=1209931 RepID=A0A135SZX1_9PEZI|nr:hypothetical protein CSAL01_13657 [Colletotrichum salicis]
MTTSSQYSLNARQKTSQLEQPRLRPLLRRPPYNPPVLNSIIHPQRRTPNNDNKKQRRISPVARRVPPGLLLGLVDPYARDLPEPGADADVERDGEPRRRRAEHVGRQPTQQRRDARKCARGAGDEAAVARVVGVGREDGRDGEGDAADEG